MGEKRKRKLCAFLPAVLMMAAIFFFSAQPSEDSSVVSEGLGIGLFTAANHLFGFGWSMKRIAELSVEAQHAIRKMAHFTEYLALGMAFVLGFRTNLGEGGQDAPEGKWRSARGIPRWAAPSFFCAVLYAVSDEFHQLFVPGRAGAFGDVVFDCVGALVGVALLVLIRPLKKRKDVRI